MDDTVVIALFRHGMTEANKRQAYLGWTDSQLIDTEWSLCGKEYDLIFTSDLGRCMKTAEKLFPEQRKIKCRGYRELSFGDWECKTYEELKSFQEYRSWVANPYSNQPPGGESFQDFTSRIENAWRDSIERILEEEKSSAAIVTHGGVIRYLLSKYASESKDFWDWLIPYGKGYELVWNRSALRRGERCILLQEAVSTAKDNG
ncbi:histidine phosphatase family protein [Bacillus massilinigeriensis]|uniref:histidine phosphatase family protein n=1 Tax=Bacillus mediterraneensis TaxID=1805474 RepID=UPI0008F847A3|nr:histidine phosphatase family protein [Bacillus mediterraneensis]